MVSDKKAKKKKKAAKKKTSLALVKKPEVIKNRHLFRDQLTANGFDLVGEIAKNIKLVKSPEDKLKHLFRLMEYAYNPLEGVAAIEPDPDESNQNNGNVIEGELVDGLDDDLKGI